MFARTHNSPEGAGGNGKIAQSYIAGIGASGALLAGAVVTFVFLVGAVSFQVWPAATDRGSGPQALPVAELAGPAASGAEAAQVSLGGAVVALAAAVPVDAKALNAGGGVQGGGGSSEGSGDGGSVPPTPGGGTGVADDPDPPSNGGGGGGGGGDTDRPSSNGGGQGDRGNSGSNGGSTGTGTGTTQTGPGSGSSGGSDHTQRGGGRGDR